MITTEERKKDPDDKLKKAIESGIEIVKEDFVKNKVFKEYFSINFLEDKSKFRYFQILRKD